MAKLNWYVAITRSCLERKVAEHLLQQGVEAYVPVTTEAHKWSDRVKMVDKLIFPRMVFVHCSEADRRASFRNVYGITSYMPDRTSKDSRVLVIPDRQMADFMRVVRARNGEEDISVVDYVIAPGAMIRVVRGPLEGFVCECVEIQNKHNLVVRLGLLGTLLVSVNMADVVLER